MELQFIPLINPPEDSLPCAPIDLVVFVFTIKQRFPTPLNSLTIGVDWVRTNREVGLRVPSAVIPQEWNMLLNPAHRDFSGIEWTKDGPFHWDARLKRHVIR